MTSVSTSDTGTLRVWDPLVRLFHWSLVAAFAAAWVTADEWERAHEIVGYAVIALLAVRLMWGFVGTRHARFADFVRGPTEVIAYLKDTAARRARRYIGHNPAGGAMVVAMLVMLAAVCGTGLMLTTTFSEVKWVEELHEASAYALLALVVVHVLGVVVASLEHHENLVRAMITGRKRA